MRLALVVALGWFASCRAQPAPTGPVEATVRRAPTPVPVMEPELAPPPAVRSPCSTAIGATVTAENRTRVRGSVCGAFARVVARVPVGVGIPPDVELHVALGELDGTRPIYCAIEISVAAGGKDLGRVHGGAKVAVEPGQERVGTRECVEAVIEDLLRRRIWPLVRQHAQTVTSVQRTAAPSGIPVP